MTKFLSYPSILAVDTGTIRFRANEFWILHIWGLVVAESDHDGRLTSAQFHCQSSRRIFSNQDTNKISIQNVWGHSGWVVVCACRAKWYTKAWTNAIFPFDGFAERKGRSSAIRRTQSSESYLLDSLAGRMRIRTGSLRFRTQWSWQAGHHRSIIHSCLPRRTVDLT